MPFKKGNPHAFKHGQSGNPAGRPKVDEDARELAKAHSVEAVQGLIKILRTGESDSVKLSAACRILDQALGRPKEQKDVDVKGGLNFTIRNLIAEIDKAE